MENKEKKKMSKSTIILIIVAAAVVFLTIMLVGGTFTLNKLGIIHLSFGRDAYEAKTAENEARNFVNALMKSDNKKAFKCVDVVESDFITKDDLENNLPKTKYQDIIGSKGKITSVTSGEGLTTKTVYVTVSYGMGLNKEVKSVTVKCKLNDNNRWKVDLSDICVKDWKISAPGGCKITIDGKEVDEKYKIESDNLYDNYKIPAILDSEKEVKIITNSFGESTQKVTPSSSSISKKIEMEPNDETVKSAYEFVKNTWNAMYNEYVAGSDVSNVKKYFDSSVSDEVINSCYKKAFDSLTNASSTYKNTDFVMTNIVDRKSSQNYVSTNEIITLNFGYTLNWNYNSSSSSFPRTMNRYSSIRLKKDGDSWKIYNVTDTRLFSYSSQYTKNF